MNDRTRKVRAAQIEAGERAVVESLRSKGTNGELMVDDLKYSVGRLRDPRPEDPRFEDRGKALAAAFDRARDLDHVWAMWIGDSIAAVFYDGQMFT